MLHILLYCHKSPILQRLPSLFHRQGNGGSEKESNSPQGYSDWGFFHTSLKCMLVSPTWVQGKVIKNHRQSFCGCLQPFSFGVKNAKNGAIEICFSSVFNTISPRNTSYYFFLLWWSLLGLYWMWAWAPIPWMTQCAVKQVVLTASLESAVLGGRKEHLRGKKKREGESVQGHVTDNLLLNVKPRDCLVSWDQL